MEPHKQLDGFKEYTPPLDEGAIKYFEKALIFARAFYQVELNQISSVKFKEIFPDYFFREAVWVIHATGFSAQAVGKFFDCLMNAYRGWSFLAQENKASAIERCRKVVNNPQKIGAVWQIANDIHNGINKLGWKQYKQDYLSSPDLLKDLPYIGKITCYHLARNIGLLECVKPDLHLVRLAKYWGYNDCLKMCKAIQERHFQVSGEKLPLGIIDLCLWYSASTFGTLDIREEGDR